MANDTAQNIIKGFLAGGAGSFSGQAAGAQAKRDRQAARNAEIREILLNKSRIDLNEFKQQPKPEKPADTGKWKPYGKTGWLYNELTGETMEAVGIPQDVGGTTASKAPKKDPTIAEFGKVVGGREKEAGTARKEFVEQLPSRVGLEDEFAVGVTPEEALSSILSTVPQTKEKFSLFGKGDTIENPAFEEMVKLLESAGGVPQEYEQPTGSGLHALQDSIGQAQLGDIDIAAALRQFEPEKKGVRELFGLDKAKKSDDPEVHKAQRKLETGVWTQEKFDRWLTQWQAKDK